MLNLQTVPSQTPISEDGKLPTAFKGRLVRRVWITFFNAVVSALQATASMVGQVTLTLQNASVGVTAISTPTLNTGLYRINWYLQITQAAGTSSGVMITIGWTQGGLPFTASGANLTGNTLDSQQSGSILASIDPNTSITYALTYASVGAPVMQYSVAVVVEALP